MFQDEKIKVKILWLPINKKGELVLDYKNTESLTLSLYMLLETLKTKQRVDTLEYRINGIKVIGEQATAIAGLSTGWWSDQDDVARAKINEIITMLRTHGLIAT